MITFMGFWIPQKGSFYDPNDVFNNDVMIMY